MAANAEYRFTVNGEEQVVDLTRFAFAHARTDADLFRRELKARIEQLLAR